MSFDKASDARKIKRQQKLEVTKLDYELKAPSPMNTSICGKRFPSKFSTKKSVKKHLKRIIWVLSAQHSALNYPVDHLGTLTPNMPTKLYKDPRVWFEHYSIYNLATAFTGGAQVSVAMTLASMRYDSLFDYGTSLPDTKGGEVLQEYYNYLHTSVKSILQRRNAERFERGYLPYPYLVPGWIANSVHTWSGKELVPHSKHFNGL